MAKRIKSVQTNSIRDTASDREASRPEAVESRTSQQTAGSAQGTSSAVIEESDRAAAAIPDSVLAENDARERISARAYELYLLRGGGHGRDTDDWLSAEREIGSRSDRPNDE